jgi:hypothetical protein
MDNGVMGGGRSAPRLSRRGRLLLAVAVPAVAALEAYAQRPLWEHYAALGGLCGLMPACRLDREAAAAEGKRVSKSLSAEAVPMLPAENLFLKV